MSRSTAEFRSCSVPAIPKYWARSRHPTVDLWPSREPTPPATCGRSRISDVPLQRTHRTIDLARSEINLNDPYRKSKFPWRSESPLWDVKRAPRRVSHSGRARANKNVWSAALSQAKNENDRVVCANVFGLRWSTKLLALMECAARSSYLVMQPWKAFPVYRFRERRVRPLCHLMVRQQTWQKIINSVVAAGL